MTAVSPFASAGPALRELGHHCLVPVLPPTLGRPGAGKAPGRWAGGGWQGLPSWSKFKDSPPSQFEFAMWLKAPDAGIGMLCGAPAGQMEDGTRLVVVGIDVDCDGDDLDTILRAIPGPVRMAKAGNTGQTTFVRAPIHMVSKSYDRAATEDTKASRLVDWLAGGRFCVLPPSVHVTSRKEYRWLAGPCAPEDLPIFTDDNLVVLEETLETLGWSPDKGARQSVDHLPTHRVPGEYSDDFARANGEGLARLNEWFADLGLPKTAQTRSGVWSAVPTWRESNSGRPTEMRKANLSASSGRGAVGAGIRDFGATPPDDRLTAIDLVMRALDLDAVQAMQWLTERLALDEDDGIVIDLEAFAASKHTTPPTNPRAGEVVRGAACEASGDGAENAARVVQPSTHGAEMPAHLLAECPGLVGGIADYITAAARKPQPVFALAAALMIVGAAAGRRYAGPTDSGTHLYGVLCGASGIGKDHPLDMVARILEAADMSQHIGPGEFMSFQAAYKSISRQPLQLCPMDELGSWFRRLSGRGAQGNETAMTGVLRSAWGKSFGTLPVPSWATEIMPAVNVPALSIIGASTPEEFFTSLENGSIDNGFLNRWLLFPSYTRPDARRPEASKFEVPQLIVDGLKAIYNVGGPMALATMHHGKCDKPLVKAEWEGGEEGSLAREYLTWAATLDEQSDTESLFARCAEQTIRIATIRAIGSDAVNPVIDRPCFEWARSVVLWCTNAMVSQSGDFMAENQTQADRARVLRAIKKAGSITHRDLTRKLTTFKARELDDIVKLLEVAEMVQSEKVVNPTNGKTTKRYTFTGDA